MHIYTIQKYLNILTTEYPLYLDCGFLCIYGKFYGAKMTQDVHNMKRCIKYQKCDSRYNF